MFFVYSLINGFNYAVCVPCYKLYSAGSMFDALAYIHLYVLCQLETDFRYVNLKTCDQLVLHTTVNSKSFKGKNFCGFC